MIGAHTARALVDLGDDCCYAPTPGPRPDLLPGGQHGPYVDITRLTQDTGFTPAFDLTKAVADYVAWRAANPR